jgi:hypothetical protein
MEPQENPVEVTSEAAEEEKEVLKEVLTRPKPMATTTEPAQSIAATPESDTLQVSDDLWEKAKQLWQEYFGEGKKLNLTIIIAVIATIPVLTATSLLLDFLNKFPLLPSLFELVGFGYSVWFVYRYLLLANTRKELTDAIIGLKDKVFG